MTIIAYRDGILAADTAAWRGDYISGFVRKTCRLLDGGLAAAAGASSITEWFLARMEQARDLSSPPTDPDDHGFGFLVIRPNGDVFHGDLNMLMVPVKADWHVLGRSSGFTAGALAAGASAEDAVRLTLEWTDAGRGPVQVERLCATHLLERHTTARKSHGEPGAIVAFGGQV